MSYSIFRMQKVHLNNIGNLEMHNERKTDSHSNKDINVELSKNNVQIIECKSYKKAIQNNINKYYKSDRNIRKDAVIAVETIFTSDYEFFKNKSEKEKELFFNKSLEFLQEFVGEKNIIAATVHYDETTPHMHCVFTPIDNEGKLKYKSFVSHKNDLIKLQDKYHQKMSEYFPELERGKSSKDTERKHLTVEEYKIISSPTENDLKKVANFRKNLEYLENYFPIIEYKGVQKLLYSDEVRFKQEDIKKIRGFLNSLKTDVITSERILNENLSQDQELKKINKLYERTENNSLVKDKKIWDLEKELSKKDKELKKNKKIMETIFAEAPEVKQKWEQTKEKLYPERESLWRKQKEKDRGMER